MAQSKEELLAKARERTAKNRAAKKEAAANQGVEQAPAATPIQVDDNDQVVEAPKEEKPADQVDDSAKSETPTVNEVESTESTDSTEATDHEPVKQEKSIDSGSVIVISPFRDKDNFNKTWNIGDNISHFPADRLKKIIDLKLAEKR